MRLPTSASASSLPYQSARASSAVCVTASSRKKRPDMVFCISSLSSNSSMSLVNLVLAHPCVFHTYVAMPGITSVVVAQRNFLSHAQPMSNRRSAAFPTSDARNAARLEASLYPMPHHSCLCRYPCS